MLPVIFLLVGLCIYRLNRKNKAAAVLVLAGSLLTMAGSIAFALLPSLSLEAVGAEGANGVYSTPAFPGLWEAAMLLCTLGLILVAAGLVLTLSSRRMTEESPPVGRPVCSADPGNVAN